MSIVKESFVLRLGLGGFTKLIIDAKREKHQFSFFELRQFKREM